MVAMDHGTAEGDTPEVIEAEGRAAGVFNAVKSGPIVADKVLTNEFLAGRGQVRSGVAPCRFLAYPPRETPCNSQRTALSAKIEIGRELRRLAPVNKFLDRRGGPPLAASIIAGTRA